MAITADRLNRGLGRVPGQPWEEEKMNDVGMVWFRPSINLSHMVKGGKHKISKKFADELSAKGYGKILGSADESTVKGGKSKKKSGEWPLDTPPAEYIERFAERYAKGDVSDTVKERYELALEILAKE